MTDPAVRLAVDIGGTFTDLALDHPGGPTTTKLLTTPANPAEAVLAGIAQVLDRSGYAPGDVSLVIHGTTLATNALIERRGAKTALITTRGHRDALAMAHEDRFEQYDLTIERPEPLVPRHLRLPVTERLDSQGRVRVALAEDEVHALVPTLEAAGVESVAIGFLHGYANGDHERRTADILGQALPHLWISRAGDVCPEIREYERLSTAVANAYVQPIMARYLGRLAAALTDRGFACPFLLMTSGGGLTTVETASRFPIRLVESGPAGGAILAARIARETGSQRLLSFDMGGTTAKLCLIDDASPLTSRTFEVDRVYRFKRGSGLPVRIPVIEMVEIGAGGGSVASVDALSRIRVGPESAGSEPGPVCYGRGGTAPTVTDADVTLGKIPDEKFAAGTMDLDRPAAGRAIDRDVGRPLGLDRDWAALSVSEMVDETMTAAARAHAVEWGKDMAGRTMVAFGGAAPLHAVRLAHKLGCKQVIVPTGAGVGSAIGFLLAPVSYEVIRSHFMSLSGFDGAVAQGLVDDMAAEAEAVVRQAAPDAILERAGRAFMRYRGQGFEIAVPLPERALRDQDSETLKAAFEHAYRALYGRTIPGQDIEILSWTLSVSAPATSAPSARDRPAQQDPPEPRSHQQVFDAGDQRRRSYRVYDRGTLRPGMMVSGPALVTEDQTTTVIPNGYGLAVDARGYLVIEPAA